MTDRVLYEKQSIKPLTLKLRPGPESNQTSTYVKLTDTQKKINYRNKKFQDTKLRKIWTKLPNEEMSYLWTSDPDRHGKEFFDFGECKILNAEYSKTAVVRVWIHDIVNHKKIIKSILVRESTGKPVVWSGKWIDVDIDEKHVKNIKKIIENNRENVKEKKTKSVSIEESENCDRKIRKPYWQEEDTFYKRYGQ